MIWLIALVIILPFSIVLAFGAPYLPTRSKQAKQALDLLDLKRGDLLLDLGCGDGSVLIEAARRGIKGIGYEINPYIFLIAKIRTWRYRSLIKIKYKNYWTTTLPQETKGVFVFLLDKYMTKLDNKLKDELSNGSRLVSYSFKIKGKKVDKSSGPLVMYKY